MTKQIFKRELVREMRFKLRLLGVSTIGDCDDKQVVTMYNIAFKSEYQYIGIDRDGKCVK